MENLVPLGTGNSRLMKSNIPPNTTLAQLIQMWNNGTFPYDIGPLNSAGISQQGTPLTKDTLLKDATAALFGLGTDAVPDDALSAINTLIDGKASIVTGSYVGTGTYGSGNPTTISLFPGAKLLFLTRPKYSYQMGYTVSTIHLWDLTSTYTPIAYISPATARYNLAYSSNEVQNTGVMAKMDSGVLSIYNTIQDASQLNVSGATYYWMAIG